MQKENLTNNFKREMQKRMSSEIRNAYNSIIELPNLCNSSHLDPIKTAKLLKAVNETYTHVKNSFDLSFALKSCLMASVIDIALNKEVQEEMSLEITNAYDSIKKLQTLCISLELDSEQELLNTLNKTFRYIQESYGTSFTAMACLVAPMMEAAAIAKEVDGPR